LIDCAVAANAERSAKLKVATRNRMTMKRVR
jgi:hypothetical protein